jgi:hypothetical protein
MSCTRLSAGELPRACLIKFSRALGANPPSFGPPRPVRRSTTLRGGFSVGENNAQPPRAQVCKCLFTSRVTTRTRAADAQVTVMQKSHLSLAVANQDEIGPRHLPRRRPILSSRSIDTTDIEIHRLRGGCLLRPSRALNPRHLSKLRSMRII